MWIQKGFHCAICFIVSLSKAFDTLNLELLIAKCSVHDFNNESLKLIRSYLTNRWQRTKINKSFSRWTELLQGRGGFVKSWTSYPGKYSDLSEGATETK